jgi:uncharacterized protein
VIVKMDDVGLHLAQRSSATAQRLGLGLVGFMPRLLAAVSLVGTAAMLWVGGHIELVGFDELGWHAPYDAVHHLQEQVQHAVPGAGAALGWLVNTLASAVLGLLVGAVLVVAVHLLPLGKKGAPAH